jgi:tetratricopeptide (TPR) repeat protein
MSRIPARIASILAFVLLLSACQTTGSRSTGSLDDQAIRLGNPSQAELQAFTNQLAANAAERGLGPQQASVAFSRLAWERLAARRYDEAAPFLNRAWALDPANATVAAGFAMLLYYRDGEPEAAVAEMQRAIALHPNDPGLRMNLGQLLADERRDREAIAAFQQALLLDPDTPNVHLALSLLFQRTGEYRKALDHARISHSRGEIPDPLRIRALEERVAEES